MKRLTVERPGPDVTPEEQAEWKRMHAELGRETDANLRRIMSKEAPLTEYDELAEMADELKELRDDNTALLGLRDVLRQLENYPFGGHVPPEMRKLASDALAALPESLR